MNRLSTPQEKRREGLPHTRGDEPHWRTTAISKYKKATQHQRIEYADISAQVPKGKKVLVVICQTTGDATMFYPQTLVQDKERLSRLVCNAMKAEEEWVVWIKPHPYEEHRGLVSIAAEQSNAELVLNANAHAVLQVADACVTINSTMGFEALMYGLPVITLGDNIYTNRGLTTDIRDPSTDLAEQIRDAIVTAKKPPRGKLERFLYAVIFKYLFMHNLDTQRMESIAERIKTSS